VVFKIANTSDTTHAAMVVTRPDGKKAALELTGPRWSSPRSWSWTWRTALQDRSLLESEFVVVERGILKGVARPHDHDLAKTIVGPVSPNFLRRRAIGSVTTMAACFGALGLAILKDPRGRTS